MTSLSALSAFITALPGRLRRRLRRARRPRPPMREFSLELPRPPEGARRRWRQRTRLRVRAGMPLYIPKLLEEAGLADYEPETMSCFLAATQVLPRGAVLDVGANVGVFALVAAAVSDWKVVAFEPTPDLAATLRALARLNRLRCRVEPIALGARAGTATLYLSSVTDSSNSLREGFRPSSREISVDVITLDEYCRSTGIRPSLLKIDTESTEPDVLRGATEVLTRDRPWIICEVLAGRTEAELMRVLEPFGYAWYQLTEEERPVRRREIVGDATYKAMNWLFAPEPPDDSFWEARQRWLDAIRRTAPPGRSESRA